MPEGKVGFSATHTPSWDEFKTVTLTAGVSQVGGGGAVLLHAEVSVEEAYAYAAQIERACQIVEADQR